MPAGVPGRRQLCIPSWRCWLKERPTPLREAFAGSSRRSVRTEAGLPKTVSMKVPGLRRWLLCCLRSAWDPRSTLVRSTGCWLPTARNPAWGIDCGNGCWETKGRPIRSTRGGPGCRARRLGWDRHPCRFWPSTKRTGAARLREFNNASSQAAGFCWPGCVQMAAGITGRPVRQVMSRDPIRRLPAWRWLLSGA